MTGDQSLLKNFVEKFIGTVRFRNDQFTTITGYGDYVKGNITVCHVYYIEGLGHNLVSVRQFYDGDLEVSFRLKTCYVRNLEEDDLLTGDRESNLYTISNSKMAASSHVCLMSKATLTKSWTNITFVLHVSEERARKLLIHLKWFQVYFLCTKDETPEIIKKFIARVQLNYNANVCKIRTDNGTEIKNGTLKAHYDKLGNMQQFSIARTPQQNGVVEGHNPESMNIPTKEELDNLFGPMYEEYFEKRSSDTSINSAAQQVHNHEDSPLTSSIVLEEHGAPPIVTTSEEQTSPISFNEADEFNQEDSSDFDGNTIFVPYDATNFEEAESSTKALDLSNMHEFHQVQPLTHIWTKARPLEQVTGDPSKHVMTR
ncbi:integrase, catalytic region, zinc finger, CCHC-type containing protein [Tanacetum coccineum]